MHGSKRPLGWAPLFGFLLLSPLSRATAQVTPDPLRPATTGGLERIDRNLAKLEVHARMLVIGAHPDDEDTSLLAWVATGFGGEAAYLSLSRGEGGQNLVGADLGVGLGLLRTRELEAARRVDGARQFFTRAVDFGYTTSLQETLDRWPREALLADALRVVRRFRPQVVVSIFPADGGGGHGQHQEAGLIAHQAYVMASDESARPELREEGLATWKPEALYRAAWFDRQAATMTLSTARLDPWSGRSIHQIAMASRGQHRSQDMGRLQDLGPRETRLAWVAGAGGVAATSPFSGIDTRLRSLAALVPEGRSRQDVASRLERVEVLAHAARGRLHAADPSVVVSPLREILTKLKEARERARLAAAAAVVELLDEKIDTASAALAGALGIAVDASVDASVDAVGAIAAGESTEVRWAAWNAGAQLVRLEGVELEAAPGLRRTSALAAGEDLPAGTLREGKYAVATDATASTVPYFLRRELQGSLYDWSAAAPADRGQSFGAPPLRLRFRWRVGDTAFDIPREVVTRRADQVVGEVRQPLRLAPALEIAVETPLEILRQADDRPRVSRVHLRSNSLTALKGRLRVSAPEGWSQPAPREIAIPAGGSEVVELPWSAPVRRAPGRSEIRVRVELEDGRVFTQAESRLDYAHVPPAERPVEARIEVEALDLTWPVRTVGYVRGASDRVPESLIAAGLAVDLLSGADLERATAAGLDRFDVIVIGARAYEAEPALRDARASLEQYVRTGGTLLIQYQQYPFLDQGQALVPFTIARPHDRVTDEAAPMRPLAPAHPVFLHPHRLEASDWAGWVQERGLYFAHDWDPAYQPLLEIGAGDAALRGGLLVAPLGAGTYVYTGLAFFRQLPAGVPGAYRLFANLLSLSKPRSVTR